mmetsp:Transcript_64039/g.152721  ORF Transcript_64039/g.152721 Transcript_64039/m.152721 type:complete len:316 (+) Transcript_64039:93-1040(+)
MVRLRIGRFASELYYTRMKAARRPEEFKRIGTFVLGHAGYITGLFEYMMTDIILLRKFAIAGCSMIVSYQLLQPKIQWISVAWNSLYCGINVYQIWDAIYRPQPAPSEYEQKLLHALGESLTPQQVKDLAEIGSWRWYASTDPMADQGCCSVDDELLLIAEGECEVHLDGRKLCALHAGNLLGEVRPLSGTSSGGKVSVRVQGYSMLCLVLPWQQLQKKLDGAPLLKAELQGLLVHSLAEKLVNTNQTLKSLQYGAVLETSCTIEPSDALRGQLQKMRQDLDLSEEDHHRVFDDVPECRQHLGKSSILLTRASAL